MNHYLIFFGKLLAVIIISSCIMTFVHTFPVFYHYKNLSFYSIAMFAVMSVFLYFFLYKSLYVKDRQIFISVTLLNMFVRMAGSVVILLVYKNKIDPPNNKFIISFLIIYVIFTIFETYFMVGLADKKHENKTL